MRNYENYLNKKSHFFVNRRPKKVKRFKSFCFYDKWMPNGTVQSGDWCFLHFQVKIAENLSNWSQGTSDVFWIFSAEISVLRSGKTRLAWISIMCKRLMYVIWIQSWRLQAARAVIASEKRNGNCNLLNFGSLGFGGPFITLAIPIHFITVSVSPIGPQYRNESYIQLSQPLMLCGS